MRSRPVRFFLVSCPNYIKTRVNRGSLWKFRVLDHFGDDIRNVLIIYAPWCKMRTCMAKKKKKKKGTVIPVLSTLYTLSSRHGQRIPTGSIIIVLYTLAEVVGSEPKDFITRRSTRTPYVRFRLCIFDFFHLHSRTSVDEKTENTHWRNAVRSEYYRIKSRSMINEKSKKGIFKLYIFFFCGYH